MKKSKHLLIFVINIHIPNKGNVHITFFWRPIYNQTQESAAKPLQE
ncbi:hypothetical protein GCWU000325_01406 [Alloprevotella tannerae ATCC 51259]|uniref:Uncharacterized protein n=1 Tax=Alloprevotella tannerae ATCC 51259 TaxID=626522 RepID=C9LGR0_9BACT|nr:hypothetical protein GCWU000325_01406 [Alloprevotella tannerae ATCC 51259]